MPINFPCPNPACTQMFSPQDVRGVGSLTCPKCGLVFKFGPAKAPAAKPAPLAAKPVPPAAQPAPPATKPVPKPAPAPKAAVKPPPAVVPVAVPVPKAKPVLEETEPEPFVIPPRQQPSRRGSKTAATKGKSSRSLKSWLIPAMLAGLLIAAVVPFWLFRDRLMGDAGNDGGPEVRPPGKNYSFRPPGAPWKQDQDVARRMGANLVMVRRDLNSWFAIVARDYKDRMPRDDEMLTEAVARLKQLFSKQPEWELRDEDTFAGLPAQRLVFTAENSNSIPVSGECLMTAYNGIGYWFIGWTHSAVDPSVLGDVQQEWARTRDGFVLLKEREGWIGKQVETVEVRRREAGYRLKYAKGIWEKDDNPVDADLLLLGRDPDHPQEAKKWAWVRVFIQPAADDPEEALKEARAFVEQREKKLYPEVKLDAVPEAAKGGLADGPVEFGQVKGQVVRLRVKEGDNHERFFAIEVVPWSTFTLVLVGECAWAQREAWEDRFGPVMHSLNFEKK
jgi:hypothetical protein